MQLIRKPSEWSCILASFAMALRVSPQLLIRFIGHDGSEVVFPHLPEPMCRRGFHIQELVQLAWHLGYNVTPIEVMPVMASTDGKQTLVVGKLEQRLEVANSLVSRNEGVITGKGRSCNHAVAFSRGRVFDPDGHEFDFSQCENHSFYPNCIWIVTKRVPTTER